MTNPDPRSSECAVQRAGEPIRAAWCGVSDAQALNSACFCISLDEAALARALDVELGESGLAALVRERCPTLFAARPVFVAGAHLDRMAQLVRAVEAVVALPKYRAQVLAAAPTIAQVDAGGARGVFFGYDFHLDDERLALIEINTNAGGALLSAALARAQRACCAAVEPLMPTTQGAARFEQAIVEMFRAEWQRAGRTGPLGAVAIVDDAPAEQYLYPEFVLFERLFERHGVHAVIADPARLVLRDRRLWCDELPIDLVYNRLTDFYFEAPATKALREAYLQSAVVVTPHPQAHALYADKRRLAIFGDADRLQALGVPHEVQAVLLEHVPRTELVDPAQAERLWKARRGLFFKPSGGFGSRAAYRGDKLTRRVWQEILAGDYVAQAIAAPGERAIDGADTTQLLKFDLRSYVYDGAVQWVAARLYQGQTTNFRTPGGGFAPVFSTVDAMRGAPAVQTRGTQAPAGADDVSHASYVFLLDDASNVHPVPHALYVALARAEAAALGLAGRTLRLVDWYVRLAGGMPEAVVNETCYLVRFDVAGRMDWTMAPDAVLEQAAWPTDTERNRMRALLFGAAPAQR